MNLSDRQSDALHFIARFVKTKGYSPTVREVQEGIGHRSVSSTHAVLCSLRDLEAIEWNRELPRTLRVKRD